MEICLVLPFYIVLERFLDKDISAGEKGLMLSSGPGFSAQKVLLEW